MTGCEFYTFNSEVWYRKNDTCSKLSESDTETIGKLLDFISEFYQEAFQALQKEYKSISDIRLKNYRIACRFVKCNFGIIDNVLDIDANGRCRFERVECPLRGECKLECIVCSPKFNSKISQAEMRVLRLLYDGLSTEDIALRLYLSEYTVKNHIHNAMQRLDLHSVKEFVLYAKNNGIFNSDR